MYLHKDYKQHVEKQNCALKISFFIVIDKIQLELNHFNSKSYFYISCLKL